ncbi:MAG: hypothetical protein COX57_08685 [Alphaproteobacteria bacterium CG_4_10_14_0_2_um_filter_63_37]|nr:MAG: hypothetical protein COX57_08685 [Alphaproteobacteria bacterium CG_4_10_14_0_2_um_filter_63_37]
MMNQQNTKLKIAAMLAEVADGYIQMGNSLEERNNYLRSAITAWNLACLPFAKIERCLREYIAIYDEINTPDISENSSTLERNLRALIKRKISLYPKVKIQLLGGSIENIAGKVKWTPKTGQ